MKGMQKILLDIYIKAASPLFKTNMELSLIEEKSNSSRFIESTLYCFILRAKCWNAFHIT